MKIREILCCCGNGLGSSMLMQMNIERYLRKYKIYDVKVDHTSFSLADPLRADLYVVGLDIAPQFEQFPRVIVMKQIIDMEELEEKLTQALTTYDKQFHIE